MLAPEPGTPELRFNASGSDGLALVAVATDVEVGIDLERVRDVPDLEALARQLVDAVELRALESTPPGMRARRFLESWVRRESLAKAAGLGLRQIREATGVARPLTLAARDYVASLAATTPFEHLKCLSLVP